MATLQDIELLHLGGRGGTGIVDCDDTRLLSSSISTRCTTMGIGLSLTIMPHGTRRRSAPSGPPALPLPSSAPTEHQPPPLPQFHPFQPLQHPHVLPGHPPIAGQYPNLAGLAMNAPHYQPYGGTPYYPPVYPPPHFIPGPGQVQPWDHASGYFPVPPSPASHLVAAHLGPGNGGPPPPAAPVQGTPAHANRTKKYPNKLVREGGK